MDLLFFAHLLNALLMIAMPVGLAIFLTHKFKLGWRLWFIGAATFLLSQVGHIPFNLLLNPIFNTPVVMSLSLRQQTFLSAVLLGLSAGLFEELFRYGMYRWWARDARSWRKGIMTGAGHGGAEAIALGAITLYGFIQLVVLRNADLSKYFPPTKLALAAQQVHTFWSMSALASLQGALERFFTIPIHISLALIVLQTFIRKQWFWVWLAVFYHAVLDATAVLATAYIKGPWVEAFVAFFWAVSLVIIFAVRQPEPPEAPRSEPLPPPPAFAPKPIDESAPNLENTRYT